MSKALFAIAMIVGILTAVALLMQENVQKVVYDWKADKVGTDRVVKVYTPMGGQLLATYEDKDMRFDRDAYGWTLWLGSINRKVAVSPAAIVVVEDRP